jgi:excinuclease ABC subunit C
MEENTTPLSLSELLKILPTESGIYKFFDSQDVIIYVGKAKNLKNRVNSYFANKADLSRKTLRLVSEIRRMEYTVVNSEFDAFLLENNLIKANQPKYNILLKDDKTYPYICITNEPFPRVFPTRRHDIEESTYFGPYASVKSMHILLDLVKKLYTIRACSLALTKENIRKKKFKVCLEYHIKNCKGGCEGLQTEEDYQQDIEQVINVLKGKIGVANQYFKQQMQVAAEAWKFEEAQTFKDKLEALEKFQSKSLVANPNISDVDVFAITSDEKAAYVNYLHIQNGCIVQTQTITVKKKLEETDSEILAFVILDFRQKYGSHNHKIITNISLQVEIDRLDLQVPKIGDLKHLVELSYKNALFRKRERMNKEIELKDNSANKRIIEQLQKDLNLIRRPDHIECFDNSNIQGTNPVASMVCFKDGKASKKDYRHFKIKTVIGPNDFASMYEIVTRRYTRLIDESADLPQLIIIDGGKGQLSSACEALKALNLYGKIPIIGIAKRLEELYYPDDELPIMISKKSESLKLIQRIRDEAHRFAITFHRDLRSKNSLVSRLEEIDGIGKATTEKLLKKYKSVKKIMEIPPAEIEAFIGKDKARLVLEGLKES